jgi:predicted Kef-type K+ transport protein
VAVLTTVLTAKLQALLIAQIAILNHIYRQIATALAHTTAHKELFYKTVIVFACALAYGNINY